MTTLSVPGEVLNVLGRANPIHVLELSMATLGNLDRFDRSAACKIMTLATLFYVMCRVKGIDPAALHARTQWFVERFWEDEQDGVPILSALKAYMENEWEPSNPHTRIVSP